jgi:hypothetical protein
MTKDEIKAVVEAMVAPFEQQIVALTSAVDRLVERHEEWRRWRDQNCGRELDPSDVDYPELTASGVYAHKRKET